MATTSAALTATKIMVPSVNPKGKFNAREYPRFTKRDFDVLIRIQEITAVMDLRSLVDSILYILGGVVAIGILVTTFLR